MRSALRFAAASAALLLAAGCASGGGAGSSPQHAVLVEVRGTGPEADAFASRLLSEAEERGAALVDARLAGAHLADLKDPGSEAARKLRDAFPGDAYVGADIGPCQTFRRTASMPGAIDPLTGVRTTDVIGGVDVVCTANFSVLGADGRTKKSAVVDGTATLAGGEAGMDSSLEAARDAATRAAKKLFGRRK